MSLNEALNWILDIVASVDPVLRILLAGVGMLLETSIFLGLVFPGDSIVLVASTAVASPTEYAALLTAVVVGSLAGESIGFGLGRLFGPRIRQSWLGGRIGERNWQRAEYYVDRRGGIAIVISRFLPVLHWLVPVTVGMTTMGYRRFMTWTIPTSIIWATIWVSFGSLAAVGYRQLADQLHLAGYLFVGAVVLFVATAWLVRRVIARSESRHMSGPGDGDANTTEDDAG